MRNTAGKETGHPGSFAIEDNGIEKIDFLSIDIEESELQALAGFDIERFQPKLVCIERSHQSKQKILAYFEQHHYEMLKEYDRWDHFNWYFSPKSNIDTNKTK